MCRRFRCTRQYLRPCFSTYFAEAYASRQTRLEVSKKLIGIAEEMEAAQAEWREAKRMQEEALAAETQAKTKPVPIPPPPSDAIFEAS